METIYFDRIVELKKEKNFLERELNVKIDIKGKYVRLDGEPLDEYEAYLVLDAINLSFPVKTAILLKDEEMIFKKINIKDFSRKKRLDIVKGRLIGTKGKTKRVLEEISGCKIKIKDNFVGIIGPAESVEYTLTGITNIIKGTKQTNVYKYLEKINTLRTS